MCWQEAASRRGVSIVSSLPRRTEFWNLRDYGTGTWEGGNDPACDHVKFAAPRAERPDCGMTGGKDTVDAGNAPYRTTCGKCGARRIDRQLGLEPQVDCGSLGQAQCGQCYVCQQVRVFRLVRTAMANHAVAFVNIGDSYSSGNRTTQFDPANSKRSTLQGGTPGMAGNPVRPPPDPGIPAGNLCLIPQRLALALQRDGWIVRSVIVWRKSSAMPQSLSGWRWSRCRVKVKAQAQRTDTKRGGASERDAYQGSFNDRYHRDEGHAQWVDCPGCPKCAPHGGYVLRRGSGRCTSSWEPILMLAKSPVYYFDNIALAEAVRVKDVYPMRSNAYVRELLPNEGKQVHRTNEQVQGLHSGLSDRVQENRSVQEDLFELVEEQGTRTAKGEAKPGKKHAGRKRAAKKAKPVGEVQAGQQALHVLAQGQGNKQGGLCPTNDGSGV